MASAFVFHAYSLLEGLVAIIDRLEFFRKPLVRLAQRKLLILIYTLYKKNEAFDKDYEKNKSGRVKDAETFSRLRLEETEKAA
ncbi:MAG: hypothetical protein JWQ09_979 [Segetibacter sp.]|nr:hypothetical protein [Segetibacter sp.]